MVKKVMIMGTAGSMDIEKFLKSILPDNYQQVIMDELIAISKVEITNMMEEHGATPTEWKFEGSWLQSAFPLEIDVFFIWYGYKHLMKKAIEGTLAECPLQTEVSKIMEMYHE